MKVTRNHFSLESFVAASHPDKVSFLNDRVTDSTDLAENFVLEALAEESDPLVKWYLVKAIGIMRSTVGIQSILRVCKEPEVDFGHTTLHAICAWSLGRIGSEGLIPVLSLLDDEDTETRRCAADALGEMRDPRAVQALCSALENDEFEVKLWAGLSLAKIGSSAISCLLGVLERSPERSTCLIALDALLKTGDRYALPTLKQRLRSGSADEKRLILESGSVLIEDLEDEIQIAMESDAELVEVARRIIA